MKHAHTRQRMTNRYNNPLQKCLQQTFLTNGVSKYVCKDLFQKCVYICVCVCVCVRASVCVCVTV